MKIKSLSLISLVSVLTGASAANAGVLADFYIGAMGGIGGQSLMAEHKNHSDASRVVGGVLGMDIPFFRIEGEYDYFDSSKLNTHAALLNAYAKLPTSFIIPYIGVGAGVVFGGNHKFTENNIQTKYNIHTTTAYQAMLGTTIDILALPLKFDVEGRILYAQDIYEVPGTNIKPDMLQYGARVKARLIF